MTTGHETRHCLAEAAAHFVGIPFLLHGRDPRIGLDCVGLVYASLVRLGKYPQPPEGYRLRNTDPSIWYDFAAKSGLHPAFGPVQIGDVILVDTGPGQQHLVIAGRAGTGVHAHAGLRRVVCQPLVFPEFPRAHWRLGP